MMLRFLILVLITPASAGSVRATEDGQAVRLSAEDRLSLDRLALGRARAAMREAVRALPLADGLTVGQWAARDQAVEHGLRKWLRSRPRRGAARIYSDGVGEVDIYLSPQELRDHLLKLPEKSSDQAVSAAAVRRAARRWTDLWRTGRGDISQLRRSRKPLGWQDVTFDGIQLTRRAAAAAARQALLSKAAELKMSTSRRLGEFLDTDAAIRSATRQALKTTATVVVVFEADRVAIGRATIGMSKLIRILTDVHTAHYRGDDFRAADFREMALRAKNAEISAVAMASPSAKHIVPARYQPIELDAPRWAADTLRATGRYEPRDEDENVDADGRVEIARLDGMDALRRKAEALMIKDGVSVEKLLAYHRELKDDVVLFLTGARVVGPGKNAADGGFEIRVELPARRLWEIVRRGMRVVEVDPPENGP